MKAVRETLLSLLKSGTLAHAYLFIGPRGAGKTSTARIMAQVANCEKNQGKAEDLEEPCGKCVSCVSLTEGSAVDVIEMDAASHRSIDDIRDLREKIRLTPVALPRKIYIIDEVHMLTTEAFNALLKTLEEPPKHAMFFLCTTEAHKVPETIVSRCSVVKFAKADIGEVVRSLEKAVKGEHLEIETEMLEEIARATDGSFREGHKLLEQLAGRGEKITLEGIRAFLGIAGGESVATLVKGAVEGEGKKVVAILDELEKQGTKPAVLVTSLLKEVKAKMEEGFGSGQFGRYARLADKLITAAEKIRLSPLPMLPIELALLSVAVSEEGRSAQITESAVSPKKELSQEVKQETETSTDSIITNYETSLVSIDRVKSEWGNFLSDLAPHNQSVAGLLRATSPVAIQGSDLTIEVFYPFHKDQLEQEAKRRIVEEAVARVWGRLRVKCVLGKRSVASKEDTESEVDKAVAGQGAGSIEEIFGV